MAYTQEQLEEGIRNAIAAEDNVSANQLADLLDKEFPDRNAVAAIDVTPQPESTLLSRAGDVIEKRSSSIEDTLSRSLTTDSGAILGTQEEGSLGLGEKAIRLAGDTVGGFGEIAGDAIITGLSNITPEFMKEAVTDVLNYASNSEIGKEGLLLAAQSADKYGSWADAYPDDAKLLESYFNIGAMLTPATKIKPTIVRAATTLEESGGHIVKKGRDKITGDRKAIIAKMLEPDSKTSINPRDQEVSEGWLETVSWNPQSPYTQENLDILTKTDIIKPKKTYTYNAQAAVTEADRLGNELKANLATETVTLDKVSVIREIDLKAQKFLDENRLLDPKVAGTAEKIFGEAKRKIQEGDGSLLSLLEARQAVDAFARGSKNSIDFNTQNALAVASKSIRDTMNEILERSSEKTLVKSVLRKQSAFYNAAEEIGKKRNQDASNKIEQLKNVVVKYTPSTLPGYAATAAIGAAALANLWPIVGVGIIGGLTFKGFKVSMSGESKKLVGQIIKDTGAAIKEAEKAGHFDAVERMKADRLVLISVLNESPTEEPEEPEEPVRKVGRGQMGRQQRQ
tara:strand:+ start:1066 stop:2769 length:1704 start_codon:yes stop_codon:yes gene_type:complete